MRFSALFLALALASTVWANPPETEAAVADVATPALPNEEPVLLNDLASPADPDEFVLAEPPDAFDVPADVWIRLRGGFAMPDLSGPAVRRWENWYKSRPDYVARMIERSRRYLYHIIREVDQRDMPMEVAILPMIESAYNPMALSRARALGIWQFIPATGKRYGLEQNWWFDERRDVVSATAGALDYLQVLHGMFGDWQLALAAYNCGEGGVARAISRNRAKRMKTDYASIRLPRETREYLPKLQAVKNILRSPEAYGLHLPHVADAPYFTTVTATHPIDVQWAAELAEISIEEFVALNPAYHRPVIGGAPEHTLLLPVEKADAFVAKLALLDSSPVSWRAYHLKAGERLEQVAEKFGLSPEALRQANGIRGTRALPSGVSLLVPARTEATFGEIDLHAAVFVPPPVEMGSGFHRVRRGETLASIAGVYGATIVEIKRWNRLASAVLKPGQRLRIGEFTPSAKRVPADAKPAMKTKATVKPKRRA